MVRADKKNKLTFEEVSSLLEYNHLTGEMFWKVSKQGRNLKQPAGFLYKGCYQIKINGKSYQTHRLVWLLNTKNYPKGPIDHINGDKSDNRLANLVENVFEDCTLTQEELKKRLVYDDESGLFTRINLKHSKITHRVDDCGHVNITVSRKPYKAHRLAWLYVHGVFPSGFVDHINGVGNDNRIVNLRDSTNTQNLQNQKLRKTNTSGFKGVSWSSSQEAWQAQVCANYVTTHLGYYTTPEDVSKVYNDFAKIVHGEFYRNTTI